MEESKEASGSGLAFKKPLLVGKIGHLPKKIPAIKDPTEVPVATPESSITEFKEPEQPKLTPIEKIKEINYEEPSWSGLPASSQSDYSLEVLKNGSIIETINLMNKRYWVFGRLNNCDVCMQHPTISRHHAVLQYRAEKSSTSGTGFYIYDLESTHGTFLNKNRLKPRSFQKMHVGHMLKLGCSTRTFILNGPDEDAEEESELTVTELKQQRQEQIKQYELEKQKAEVMRQKQEEKGIDWGMGEDADEETDLSENPFAITTNEEIYIDNPKKALRGFFEREGLDLEYDCSEQGMGQFVCKVELPLDDEFGRPIFAEVLHKGKKKEAVVQCALEACRILDRHGVLRQATHESRKRKPKNWEEDDYYDSDDDTFLDRTGTIEKKREMRMKVKQPRKVETYESLLEKEKVLNSTITKLERDLTDVLLKLNTEESANPDADPLDSFMMDLKNSKPCKQSINKLKSEIAKLKQDHLNVIKLANIAKPASLPPLVASYEATSVSGSPEKKNFPIIGKRKKIKLELTTKPTHEVAEEIPSKMTLTEFEEYIKENATNHELILDKILQHLKTMICKTSSQATLELVDAKQTEIVNLLRNENDIPNLTKEFNTILNDLKIITDNEEIKLKTNHDSQESLQKEVSNTDDLFEKKKKKNQRRIQQKQERAEVQKQKGYEEDERKEDYNMWVPPSGQSGDGRTALNDKYGY